MARKAIGVENFRAQDIIQGDIVQLRIHGQQRWWWITQDATTKQQTTTLTYKSVLYQDATVEIGCWELVRTQYSKEPK